MRSCLSLVLTFVVMIAAGWILRAREAAGRASDDDVAARLEQLEEKTRSMHEAPDRTQPRQNAAAPAALTGNASLNAAIAQFEEAQARDTYNAPPAGIRVENTAWSVARSKPDYTYLSATARITNTRAEPVYVHVTAEFCNANDYVLAIGIMGTYTLAPGESKDLQAEAGLPPAPASTIRKADVHVREMP